MTVSQFPLGFSRFSSCALSRRLQSCRRQRGYDSVSAARADITDYFAWYNAHRPHSGLDRITPDDKYFGTLPSMALAA